jgi:NodT family efflux transporter outer membrane factor (OMF) lipoprotein
VGIVSGLFLVLCGNEFSAVHALAHADWRRGEWVPRVARLRAQASASVLIVALILALAGCAVGPDYSAEPAPVPTKFKELKGWKLATPNDAIDRGDWWAPYRDPALAALLREVEISNQTVAAQAAAYEEARAVIREAQAQLFPIATAGYGVTRTRTGALAGTTGGSAIGAGLRTRYTSQYTAPISGTWDLDVWGRVRRLIESDTSAAQASAADLDDAKLAAQAQLATAYFNLRAADSLRDLLRRTVAEYKHTLTITQNQYNAGVVSRADVITAQTQVLTVEAQLINVGVARAGFEHAIAMLTGRPPAELTVAQHLLGGGIPRIPVAMPSTLLERRPDIAAAERTMQQQNALIGVAEAAYYPDISLSSMIQYVGAIPLPFEAARSIGSIGANATQTLFNGGLTAAQVDAAKAAYWQSVATYRQTVLVAFQQVEDELAAIRILSEQLGVVRQAVKAAREAVDIYLNQYQAGTVAFTTVVTAEAILLGDEESELTVRQNLYLASVSLIEALGGGWDAMLMPTQVQLMKDFSLLPQLDSTPPGDAPPADATPVAPANAPPGAK